MCMCMCVRMCMCIFIYIYIYIYVHTYMYLYIGFPRAYGDRAGHGLLGGGVGVRVNPNPWGAGGGRRIHALSLPYPSYG